MKIFIAGGAGFVGQAATRLFTELGHTVRIYDKRVPVVGSGVCADIQDVELLADYMKGYDIVFHLASNADIAISAVTPTIDFVEGTQLTQKILEAMRLSGVKRIIYFSGSGVYGEVPGANFKEDYGPLLPISPYGASKLASEALISAYVHMFGMSATIFRPANIVGAGQTHGVGYDFLKKLRKDPLSLRVLGDGTQSKSYIHINDVLGAVVMAMDESITGTFNIATDNFVTVKEIAETAVKVMEAKGCDVQYGSSDRGWHGDVPQIRLNCSRLRSLGWEPEHTSAEAIYISLISMKNSQ